MKIMRDIRAAYISTGAPKILAFVSIPPVSYTHLQEESNSRL